MNYKFLSLIGALLIGCGGLMAQVYEDDIYYDGSSEVNKTTKVVVKQAPASSGYYGTLQTQVTPISGVVNGRDVDEYNRRVDVYTENDTTYIDDDTFANTRRIERFHNPTIVIRSNDPDLIEYYFDSAPTVNLIVGTGMVAGMAGHVLGTLVGDGTITTGVEDGIVLVAGMATTIGEITDATIVATTDAVPA